MGQGFYLRLDSGRSIKMINAPVTRVRVINTSGTGTLFTATKQCLVFINIYGGTGLAGRFYRNSTGFVNQIFGFNSGSDSEGSVAKSGMTLLEVGQSVFANDTGNSSITLTVLELG